MKNTNEPQVIKKVQERVDWFFEELHQFIQNKKVNAGKKNNNNILEEQMT